MWIDSKSAEFTCLADRERCWQQLRQWHPDDSGSAFPFSARLAKEQGWTGLMKRSAREAPSPLSGVAPVNELRSNRIDATLDGGEGWGEGEQRNARTTRNKSPTPRSKPECRFIRPGLDPGSVGAGGCGAGGAGGGGCGGWGGGG